MRSLNELVSAVRQASMVKIEEADRDEFAVALVLQGYDTSRAHRMAYEELEDNDGALQMLARHRLRFTATTA